jgi:hypothetical protein
MSISIGCISMAGSRAKAPEDRLLPLPCHRLLGRCPEASPRLIVGSNRGVVLGRAISSPAHEWLGVPLHASERLFHGA